MKYVYPAILYQDNGKIGVTVPDLPGCHTFGDNLADALFNAKDAVEMWLWSAEGDGTSIPTASESLPLDEDETLTLIAADTDEYRKANDTRVFRFLFVSPQGYSLGASLVVYFA
ncbi:MAG: type II toxin-antitoxin system HicB family antitoxin [Oscillospiraceae bacterium]|nr:type II toxin-antitoxin system HicB family antitoxin [Oscillospiraceae bacterium]